MPSRQPHGYGKNVSVSEKLVAYYLRQVFPDLVEQYNPPFLKGREIDMYIPSLKIGIEYDGWRFHQNTKKDTKKNRLCTKNNVVLIRIRENGCPDSRSFKYVIRTEKFNNSYSYLDKPIEELFTLLHDEFHVDKDFPKVNCKQDVSEAYKTIRCRNKEKSLAVQYPEIAKEWDYEKNAPLTPLDVFSHSSSKMWWKCPSCGNSYYASISERTGKPGHQTRCPYCSNKKFLKGFNDLQARFPDISKEFDVEKNKVLPSEIPFFSRKKVWWKCARCGHEWQASVIYRTEEGENCPECARKKRVTSCHETVMKRTGSVLENYPELAKEWDYKRNAIGPSDVSPGSNRKVWWKCPVCGCEWETTPYCRCGNHSSGCPECAKKRKRSVLETGDPVPVLQN